MTTVVDNRSFFHILPAFNAAFVTLIIMEKTVNDGPAPADQCLASCLGLGSCRDRDRLETSSSDKSASVNGLSTFVNTATEETRSSADADNRLDAFSGQSRSTNMVPFHM